MPISQNLSQLWLGSELFSKREEFHDFMKNFKVIWCKFKMGKITFHDLVGIIWNGSSVNRVWYGVASLIYEKNTRVKDNSLYSLLRKGTACLDETEHIEQDLLVF